jgi:hypothetical protein
MVPFVSIAPWLSLAYGGKMGWLRFPVKPAICPVAGRRFVYPSLCRQAHPFT